MGTTHHQYFLSQNLLQYLVNFAITLYDFAQTGDHSSTINRNIVKGPDYGVNVVKQQLTVPTQPGGVTMAVPVRSAANMQSQISGKGPRIDPCGTPS